MTRFEDLVDMTLIIEDTISYSIFTHSNHSLIAMNILMMAIAVLMMMIIIEG